MDLRKIRKNELKKAAAVMADCFYDYPLYDVFFGKPEETKNEKKRWRQIFYFFWFRLYTRKNYTYVTDGLEVIVSYRRPGDKDVSPVGIALNPRFIFGFFKNIPLSVFSLISDLSKTEEGLNNKYYNPATDAYIPMVCVQKGARGMDTFFSMAKRYDTGLTIYAETHDRRHERLYRMLGFQTMEVVSFRGVDHYVVRRDAVDRVTKEEDAERV